MAREVKPYPLGTAAKSFVPEIVTDPMHNSPRRQLLSLEVGRFVAALLVALFHIESAIHKFYDRFVLNDIFRSGHAGVEYFFVLSGFIIYWVHRNDIGHANRGMTFLTKRAVRILPMYWLAFGSLAIGYHFFPAFLQGRTWSGFEYICDFFLLPRDGDMVLGVAWTLKNEFVFYFVFLMGILIPRIGFTLLISWQMLIVVLLMFGFHSESEITKTFLASYNLGFGAGVLAAYFAILKSAGSPSRWIAGGLFGFMAIMIFDWQLGRDLPHATLSLGETYGPILYTTAAAILVFGLASLEAQHSLGKLRFVSILGGASYVLYLFHGIVSSLLLRLIRFHLGPDVPPEAVFVILAIAIILAAIVIHLYIEKPILRFIRQKPQLRLSVS